MTELGCFLGWWSWNVFLAKLNLVIFYDFVSFGNICFLWSNGDGIVLLAEVDFVFEIFRLVLIGKETYFVWQSKDSLVGETKCF